MKKRYFVVIAVFVSLLLTAVSCKNNMPAVSQGSTPEKSVYDNSEYTLIRTSIEVTGTGTSSSRQSAKDLSLSNTRRTAVNTLTDIVKQVASNRHFSVKESVEFTLPALRSIKYDYFQKDGKTKFVCTATISLPAVTKELYSCIKAPQDYGYYQFLRDVDLVIGLNQFKSNFDNTIKE